MTYFLLCIYPVCFIFPKVEKIFFFLFLLHWVFIAARGPSLVAAIGATLCCSKRASHCSGFSCCKAQAIGVRASVVVARGLSSCGSRALERRLSSCGTWA